MKHVSRGSGVFLVALILLTGAGLVVGQSTAADSVFIQYQDSAPEDDGLRLNLYFTVVDEAGQAVPDAQVARAEIALSGSGTYDAELSRSVTGQSIALALDTSGSMVNALFSMRDAAIDAVNAAPAGADISIVQFDAVMRPLTSGFLDDHTAVAEAIRAGVVNADGGTCLYDAAYSGIQDLRQQPGQEGQRRALILFTDGRDELNAGHGDTCSEHTFEEVVNLATRADKPVTIHTIGLESMAMDTATLQQFADQTGGFAVVGTEEELHDRFVQIMSGLSGQWVASALTFPDQGAQTAILRASLTNGQQLQPDIVEFTTQQSFVQTPTPVPTNVVPTATPAPPTLEIVGIQTDTGAGEVSFELEGSNLDPITEFLFRFQNEDTGTQQQEEIRSAPLEGRQVFVARNWPSGRYTVRVTGLDQQGNRLVSVNSNPFRYELPVVITPTATPVVVTLVLDSPRKEGDMIIFPVRPENEDLIDNYVIVFINENGIALQPLTYPAPTNELRVPGSEILGGRYTVEVRAQSESGEVLAETRLAGTLVIPTPPPPTPTLEATVAVTPTAVPVVQPAFPSVEWVRSNTTLVVPVAVILLLALILILLLLLRGSRRKPKSTGWTDLTGGAVAAPSKTPAPYGEYGEEEDPGETRPDGDDTNEGIDSGDVTNAEISGDVTNFVVEYPIPASQVRIERSLDTAMSGQTVRLEKFPFTIGRALTNSLSVSQDKNVSGAHVRIDYDHSTGFTITDVGSSHGTEVDGVTIDKRKPVSLPNGARVHLAKTTVIVFEQLEVSGGGY